jgi:glycolate oxidase iron-sulfur subunit
MGIPGIRGPAMALARAFRATAIPEVLVERLPDGGRLGQLRLGMGMIAATAGNPTFPDRLGDHRPTSSEWKGTGVESRANPGTSAGPRTAVLLGCIQEGLLSRVNRATERVLAANGFSPMRVDGLGCCGALHAHTGDLKGARELARRNILALEEARVDRVAVNAAGCGAIMKDYGHILRDDSEFRDRAESAAEKIFDVSEILVGPGLRNGAPLNVRVTYDAPCHLLHAQRVAREPVDLLNGIPGLELVPLPGHEECCGGAGVYGITHADLGGRIGRDKVAAILSTGAQVVATGNPGCMMQIGAGLRMAGSRIEVVHPVELLDESYRRGGLYP